MQLSKKLAALLAGAVVLASLGTVSAVAAPGDHKTTICHKTGQPNKFVLITVDDHALAAHRAHHNGGDIIPAPDNGKCPGDMDEPPDTKDVVICHRTDDDEPFTKITVQEGPELQAHLDHGDQLPDPDTQACPPVGDDDDDDDDDDGDGGNGCSNSGNVGINLNICRLATPVSLINILGSNEQTAVTGSGDEDDDGDGSDCTNEDNVGVNLGLCAIALPINVLNVLGENEQFAATP